MSGKKQSCGNEQISLSDILRLAGNIEGKYSSDEIEELIDKLRAAKRIAEEHEAAERRRREKEESERKAREEKERREAHIREVTCMDLPLDWNIGGQKMKIEVMYYPLVNCGGNLCKIVVEATDYASAAQIVMNMFNIPQGNIYAVNTYIG